MILPYNQLQTMHRKLKREPLNLQKKTDITSRDETSILADTTSSITTSPYSIKQSTLTPNDKETIKKTYEDLGTSKTWRLSTCTVVEKKKEALALACNYEQYVIEPQDN